MVTHSCGALLVESWRLLLPSLGEAAKIVRGVLYVPLTEVSLYDVLCMYILCTDYVWWRGRDEDSRVR